MESLSRRESTLFDLGRISWNNFYFFVSEVSLQKVEWRVVRFRSRKRNPGSPRIEHPKIRDPESFRAIQLIDAFLISCSTCPYSNGWKVRERPIWPRQIADNLRQLSDHSVDIWLMRSWQRNFSDVLNRSNACEQIISFNHIFHAFLHHQKLHCVVSNTTN